jgi:hypothetical protein
MRLGTRLVFGKRKAAVRPSLNDRSCRKGRGVRFALSDFRLVKSTVKIGALGILAVSTLAACAGDGTYLVGTRSGQTRPGLYTAAITAGGYCYWERLRNTSGQFSGIIENGTSGAGREFVQIAATDKAFSSDGCGKWSAAKAGSYNPNRSTAQPGSYRVPNDLLPGTYAAPGGSACYWERVSSWSHDFSNLITNHLGNGRQIVTIAATDKGFTSDGCGNWKRIGN